jgi:hypothetical protein
MLKKTMADKALRAKLKIERTPLKAEVIRYSKWQLRQDLI